VRRGSVYWINLEPATPSETGKTRPGVVVSNSIQNDRLESVVVLPLSSRPPEIWPLRIRVDVSGLETSFAIIPAIRQVAKPRLQELVGHADPAALRRLTEALALYLG